MSRLLMDQLAGSQSARSLQEMLSQLPRNLHDIYDQLMGHIERKPKKEQSLAKTALSWLLLARRPVAETELLHALAIRDFSPGLDEDNVPDVIEVISSCKGFVMFDESPKTWSLVHYTAAEYLQMTQNNWGPEAQSTVTRGCLTYMAFDRFGEGYCKTDEEFELRLRNNPLYQYATNHWMDHLREVETLPEIGATSFLMSQDKVAAASQAMLLTNHKARRPGYSQDFDHRQTGLHLAAQLGLGSVVRLLLSKEHRPAVEDSRGRTPLWRATEQRHEEAMRLLSPVDRISFTLMLNFQQKSLAYSLLRITGQSIRDTKRRTATHIGVTRDDLELIKQAYVRGVDINAKDADGQSPIHLAMQNHASQAIDLLLSFSALTKGITASGWRRAYGKPASSIVALSEDAKGSKKVQFLPAEQCKRVIMTATSSQKRLL